MKNIIRITEVKSDNNILIIDTRTFPKELTSDFEYRIWSVLISKYGNQFTLWELHKDGKIVPPRGFERNVLNPSFNIDTATWDEFEL